MSTNPPGYARRWAIESRAMGGCAKCTMPALPGRAMCRKHGDADRELHRRHRAEHAAEQNAHQQELRRQRVAQGQCYHCKQPALPEQSTCWRHGEYMRRYMANRRGQEQQPLPRLERVDSLGKVDTSGDKCRCGLRLPCNDCVKPIWVYAEARREP